MWETQVHIQEGVSQELWGLQASYFAQWLSVRCSWSVQTLIGPTFMVPRWLIFSFWPYLAASGGLLGSFGPKKNISHDFWVMQGPNFGRNQPLQVSEHLFMLFWIFAHLLGCAHQPIRAAYVWKLTKSWNFHCFFKKKVCRGCFTTNMCWNCDKSTPHYLFIAKNLNQKDLGAQKFQSFQYFHFLGVFWKTVPKTWKTRGSIDAAHEPYIPWTYNFAQWFIYARACLLQNMSLVAHHSPEKLIF